MRSVLLCLCLILGAQGVSGLYALSDATPQAISFPPEEEDPCEIGPDLFCGNFVVDLNQGEVCDDGDRRDGGGCSSDCRTRAQGHFWEGLPVLAGGVPGVIPIDSLVHATGGSQLTTDFYTIDLAAPPDAAGEIVVSILGANPGTCDVSFDLVGRVGQGPLFFPSTSKGIEPCAEERFATSDSEDLRLAVIPFDTDPYLVQIWFDDFP